MKKRLSGSIALSALIVFAAVQAAGASVADRIVAVVGNEIILQSEVDQQAMMTRYQYPDAVEEPDLRIRILENLVTRKIVLTKARLDSISVNEADVDRESASRMALLRRRFKNIREMEAAFSKPFAVIEKEIKDDIRDQKLIDNLRRMKMAGVAVSYEEVEDYFRRNSTRLPQIPETVEVSQIVMYPKVNAANRAAAQAAIREIREKIRAGGDFASLAREYSQDPGSARLGGDLGYSRRGDFVKSFEDTAFALEEGEVSDIVETRFGYHILQLLDREPDAVHVRHILIAFDRENLDAAAAKAGLEDIRDDILAGKASFAEMAEKHSDDQASARLGGLIRQGDSGETMFTVSSLRDQLKDVVGSLKEEGAVSEVIRIEPKQGEPFYALFMLNKRVPAHTPGLSSDYARLERLAKEEKQGRLFLEWINELQEEVYVRISDI